MNMNAGIQRKVIIKKKNNNNPLVYSLRPRVLLYFLLKACVLECPGSAEAAVGGADRKGSSEAPRLVFCAASWSCHRGFGDAHWRPLWESDAAGQLNQPPWRANRHGPHMGQNAQLQRGGVRLTHTQDYYTNCPGNWAL